MTWPYKEDVKPEKGYSKFRKLVKGKRISMYHCAGCLLMDARVEASGIFYCPNPKCRSSGGAWFRRTLKSYKEVEGGKHTVDPKEWELAADLYIAKEKYEKLYPTKIG